MALDRSLPFPRGTCYKDGNTANTAIPNVRFLGQVYYDNDASQPISGTGDGSTVHAYGVETELMPIAWKGGGNHTYSGVAWRLSTASSATGYGKQANGVGNGGNANRGAHCVQPDDRMTPGTVIAAGDICYAVTKGLVKVRMSSSSGSWTIQRTKVTVTTTGTWRNIQTSNDVAYGMAAESATASGLAWRLVYINPAMANFHGSDDN